MTIKQNLLSDCIKQVGHMNIDLQVVWTLQAKK